MQHPCDQRTLNKIFKFPDFFSGKTLIQADGKVVKQRVGFTIGGVPPVGHDETLYTILDPDLKHFDRIWAAAGTPRAVFELKPLDLESLTGGIWIDLAEI